jgi:hypothetical protein
MSPLQPSGKDHLTPHGTWSLEELESSSQCRFPMLSGDSRATTHEFVSSEAIVADYGKIVSFCSSHEVSVCSILQTAWTVVLGGYAGTKQTFFIYQSVGSPLQTRLIGHQLDWKSTLLETLLSVNSSQQCSVPLNTSEWRQLLQPGPSNITNSAVTFYVDQNGGTGYDGELLESSLVRLKIFSLQYLLCPRTNKFLGGRCNSNLQESRQRLDTHHEVQVFSIG